MADRVGCQLVLLDLGLPDRGGIELIPLIKAMDRAVLVLTARDATEKVAALDLGEVRLTPISSSWSIANTVD